MKNKQYITGSSYCQICGKEMLRNHSCVVCNYNLETKKRKPNNK